MGQRTNVVAEIDHARRFMLEGRVMARRCKRWVRDLQRDAASELHLWGTTPQLDGLQRQRTFMEREASKYDRQYRRFRSRLRALTAGAAAAVVTMGVMAGPARAGTDTPECGPVYASRPVWDDLHRGELIGVECHADGVTRQRFYSVAPPAPRKVRG